MRNTHIPAVRHGSTSDAGHSGIRAWAALLLSVLAVALVVTTFGILSLPLALAAMALAGGLRHRGPPGRSELGIVAVVAWWVSVLAVAITAIAVIVLALDLAGLGSPDEGVQEAR